LLEFGKGSRDLRRLSCSINYDANSGSACCGRVKGGLQVIIYEAQVVIMECERVNEGDKYLRVRNFLRQWKVNIICLQESKVGAHFQHCYV
jgi:hypothetical protein